MKKFMSSVLSSDSVHCAFNDNMFCSSLQLHHVPLVLFFSDWSHLGLTATALFHLVRTSGWLGHGGADRGSLMCVCVLDAVHKAAREQSGPAVPLQGAFEPAVLPLPVHKHNVAFLKFQLGLTLGRI